MKDTTMTKYILQLGVCITFLTASAPAWAGPCPECTEVGGLICKDTTWYLADSPYCVTPDAGGSILIGCDATLTIEAGVEVRFKTGMGITVGSIPFGAGCLVARGTEGAEIRFTSNDPCEDPPGTADPGDWARIFFSDDACDAVFDAEGEYISGGILEYVIVEYAGSSGPAITAENSSPYLAYCEVHDNQDRGINVTSSGAGDVKIQYCMVHHNNSEIDGGSALAVQASGGGGVDIDYCQVFDHQDARGIYVNAGPLPATIEYCEIYNCTVNASGAGIYLTGGADHIVSHNVIEDCVAVCNECRGGGIFVDARTTLEGNIVRNNSVTASSWERVYGGGIYLGGNSDGSTLSNNEVTGNTAEAGRRARGGGVQLLFSANCTLTGNTITGNSTSYWNNEDSNGGGISLHGSGGCRLTGNTVTGNSTSGPTWALGGGIYLWDSANCTLTQNTVTGNSTSGSNAHGGGICLQNSGTGTGTDFGLRGNTVADNVMTGNDAKGGGIFVWNSGNTILESNSITGNQASGAGADAGGLGVWDSANCILTENTITNNTCGDKGGGILFNNSGSAMLQGNTITDNTCGNTGGGIWIQNSPGCTLDSSRITGNTAVNNAGGIFLWQSNNFTMTETVVKCNHTVGGTTGGIWVGGESPPSQNVSFAGDPDAGTYNTISQNDGYFVWNDNPYDASGINDIDATYLNWCTEDPGPINVCIWDFFDDASLAFVVWNPPAPPGPPCCPWDLDCNGSVGVKDLLFLLGTWGPCPPKGDCPADFDLSGDVGVKDLLFLLGAWGPCP